MVSLGIRNDVGGVSHMHRETFLAPMKWEPTIVKWEQVSEDKWEPLRYLFPVVAPLTGKVERFTPLPFTDKPQYINNTIVDDFQDEKLDLRWTFIRVPENKTYSLIENPGFLRLYSKPGIIENRKRFSFVGFRQKESDFEFEVKMKFDPTSDKVEAGVIHYQMEYNYLANLVTKTKKKFFLEQRLKEKDKKAVTLKKVLLKNYNGHIVFKLISKRDKHDFYYSLDNGLNFILYNSVDAIKTLEWNYTGALLGFYTNSNGKVTQDYADYDWVRYKDYVR